VIESLLDVGIRADGYGFQIETVYRALHRGYKVVEVPIVFHDRTAGRSKLSRKIVIEAMFMVWSLRFRR
jgi:dolichol-phosphate mannosyltransferase